MEERVRNTNRNQNQKKIDFNRKFEKKKIENGLKMSIQNTILPGGTYRQLPLLLTTIFV